MEVVLREGDWQRLSQACRQEILGLLEGAVSAVAAPAEGAANDRLRWRVPYDLNEEQARRLLHGPPSSAPGWRSSPPAPAG